MRTLRTWSLLLCICLLTVGPVAAQAIDPLPFTDRAQEERFQRLTHELRCVQCQNNSLADSDGMIARDLRHEVFRLMSEGRSDADIKTHLVARYGDFVLFKPRVEPLTWAIWFGPLLLLALGAVAGVRMFKRRAAQHQQAAPIAAEDEI